MNELIESGNFIGLPGLELKDNDYVVTAPLSCPITIQVDIVEGMDVVFCEEVDSKDAERAKIDSGHLCPCLYSLVFVKQIEWNYSLWNVYKISSGYPRRHKNETKFLGDVHFGTRKEWVRKRLSFWLVPDTFYEKHESSKLGTCFRPTKLKDGEKSSIFM